MSDVSIISIDFQRGGGVDLNPTNAQREAGNFQKRHITFQGIPISIESPKGSIRRGKNSDGKRWAHRTFADYGYIKRTEGADGDQVDVFVGPNRNSGKVFVVDQIHHNTGTFDESKCLLGFASKAQAIDCYKRSHGDGANHKVGGTAEMSIKAFKKWLKRGGGSYPVSNAPPVAEAFHLPGDAIRAMGNGDREAGYAVADEMFGHHLSYGRGVIHPTVVALIGGDHKTGQRVLKQFVQKVRHKHAEAYAEGGAAKLSKVEVNYRPGKANKRCGLCSMYRPNNSCAAVEGHINPLALCDIFERR